MKRFLIYFFLSPVVLHTMSAMYFSKFKAPIENYKCSPAYPIKFSEPRFVKQENFFDQEFLMALYEKKTLVEAEASNLFENHLPLSWEKALHDGHIQRMRVLRIGLAFRYNRYSHSGSGTQVFKEMHESLCDAHENTHNILINSQYHAHKHALAWSLQDLKRQKIILELLKVRQNIKKLTNDRHWWNQLSEDTRELFFKESGICGYDPITDFMLSKFGTPKKS
jgi:hypothetical protein